MKKFLLLSVLAALLLSGVEATRPAYYPMIGAWSPPLPYRQWRMMDERYFSMWQDGVTRLQGSVFVSQWDGLLNVSGSCNMQKPAGWQMSLMINGVGYMLANTHNQTETVDMTFLAHGAEGIEISVWQDNPAGNAIQCVLTFEGVY